jgi:hypothetical protein
MSRNDLNPYSERIYNRARRNPPPTNFSEESHSVGRSILLERLLAYQRAEAAQKARNEENERWNKLSFLGRMAEDCFGRGCFTRRRGGSYKKKARGRKTRKQRSRRTINTAS